MRFEEESDGRVVTHLILSGGADSIEWLRDDHYPPPEDPQPLRRKGR